MQRSGLHIIHRCGRLFQQYIVDACVKIEQSRLKYIRFNQNNLQSDIYIHVADAVLANDGECAGWHIVLPASLTGGARYIHQLLQDTIAIVRRYGKPHLFITYTCNVQKIRKFTKFSHRCSKAKVLMTDPLSVALLSSIIIKIVNIQHTQTIETGN